MAAPAIWSQPNRPAWSNLQSARQLSDNRILPPEVLDPEHVPTLAAKTKCRDLLIPSLNRIRYRSQQSCRPVWPKRIGRSEKLLPRLCRLQLRLIHDSPNSQRLIVDFSRLQIYFRRLTQESSTVKVPRSENAGPTSGCAKSFPPTATSSPFSTSGR
jgi:hypothetical protein